MYQIRIPDDVYRRAVEAASSQCVSLEEFVTEALRLHLGEVKYEKVVTLTPEQIAVVRESQAEIKAGKGLTIELVEEQLAAKRAEWLKTNRQ